MYQVGNEFVGHTVSEATLVTVDLVSTFQDFLEAHSNYEREDHPEKLTEEELFWELEELLWLMDSVAPDNTYFGAHEGDGALFGFWSVECDELDEGAIIPNAKDGVCEG